MISMKPSPVEKRTRVRSDMRTLRKFECIGSLPASSTSRHRSTLSPACCPPPPPPGVSSSVNRSASVAVRSSVAVCSLVAMQRSSPQVMIYNPTPLDEHLLMECRRWQWYTHCSLEFVRCLIEQREVTVPTPPLRGQRKQWQWYRLSYRGMPRRGRRRAGTDSRASTPLRGGGGPRRFSD